MSESFDNHEEFAVSAKDAMKLAKLGYRMYQYIKRFFFIYFLFFIFYFLFLYFYFLFFILSFRSILLIFYCSYLLFQDHILFIFYSLLFLLSLLSLSLPHSPLQRKKSRPNPNHEPILQIPSRSKNGGTNRGHRKWDNRKRMEG